MQTQNYNNHRQKIKPFVLYLCALLVLIFLSSAFSLGYRIYHCEKLYVSIHLLGISLALVGLFIYSYVRIFALQDRLIKQELNFRHYILYNKTLDERLNTRQIVALRFASDAELPSLIEQAINEKLSNTEIKKRISNWVGDYGRV